MDREVTYLLLGEERRAIVKDAVTNDEAKAAVIADISKSLQFIHVAPVKPKRRKSLFSTYADGFRNLLSFPDSPARNAEATLSDYIDEALPTKAPAQ